MKLEPGCGVVATASPLRMRVSHGLSTEPCQHPFSGTLTRAIGMHGGARGQHRFSTGLGNDGNNRDQSDNPDTRTGCGTWALTARFTRDKPEKPQARTLISALQELPGHDYALDLVGALVDLGDRGPARSFRR